MNHITGTDIGSVARPSRNSGGILAAFTAVGIQVLLDEAKPIGHALLHRGFDALPVTGELIEYERRHQRL